MSSARTQFLLNQAAALEATQSPALLSANGAPELVSESARLLRNGLTVTAFASFEGFISQRLEEVTTWLNLQNLPWSQYPEGLRTAPKRRAPGILASLINRLEESEQPSLDQTYLQLGEAWSKAGGGAWTLPHVALLWPGSNLSSQSLLEIVSAFAVVSDWTSITAVAKAGGFEVQATAPSFKAIANLRHNAAHKSVFDSDIIQLRNVPAQLISLGYAFDALITSAARQIAAGGELITGQSAVEQHLLEQDSSDPNIWVHKAGNPKNPSTSVTSNSGPVDKVVAESKALLDGTKGILLVREWNSTSHRVTSWHSNAI